jgi:hypothetical protein
MQQRAILKGEKAEKAEKQGSKKDESIVERGREWRGGK